MNIVQNTVDLRDIHRFSSFIASEVDFIFNPSDFDNGVFYNIV